MRRIVLTLGGTVAGMAALLAVKFQPGPSVPLAASTTAPPSAGAMPAQGTASTPGTPAAAGRAAGNAAPAPSGAAKSQAGTQPSATAKPARRGGRATTTRVIAGSVASTAYGPMQVQITVTGGRITKAAVLQQTDVGSYSGQVDSLAIPQLTNETLAAQSATIDAVSGASYTSQGYIQSLQSALDKPGA